MSNGKQDISKQLWRPNSCQFGRSMRRTSKTRAFMENIVLPMGIMVFFAVVFANMFVTGLDGVLKGY